MSSNVTRAGVLAALLVLSGCGTGAQAAPAAGPAAPTSMRSPSVPATTSATRQPSAVRVRVKPSPIPEPVFCHRVMRQTRPAIKALGKLAKHPDGRDVKVRDLEVPRDQLRASEAQAPAHLKKYVHTQVAILDAAVTQVSTGTKRDVPLEKFVDAKTEFILDCEMPE